VALFFVHLEKINVSSEQQGTSARVSRAFAARSLTINLSINSSILASAVDGLANSISSTSQYPTLLRSVEALQLMVGVLLP
jgi:hypothetical protein